MSEEKEFILSKDGRKLCIHQWEVSDANKVICIVHGLGEHGGRYTELAYHLNSSQISVFAIDLRGHGLTEGKRGHTPSYSLLQSDIEELLKHARSLNTDAKLILMGHSMGGNLVASYVKNDQTKELSGYILSAPFFDVAFAPPKWKITLAKLVGKILPSLTQGNELDVNAISRNENEVEKYIADPLIHNQISVGWFLAFSTVGKKLLADDRLISTPGLIYHGDADRLVSFGATEKFASKNANAKWVPLSGVYHEPHNDLGKEEVYAMIVDFINQSK
jgi:acylglycerol lipase